MNINKTHQGWFVLLSELKHFTSEQRKNRLYMDEKTTELGEVKEEKNRKVKRKNKGTVLLLYLTCNL